MPYKKEFVTIREILETRKGHGIRCNSKAIAREYHSRLQKGEHSKDVIPDLMRRLNQNRAQVIAALRQGKTCLASGRCSGKCKNFNGRLP